MSSTKVIRKQQKEQERLMGLAFVKFTKEKEREIPDGIIASMLTMAERNSFTSIDQAYEDLLTLFDLYDNTKKDLRVVDATS